MSPKATHRDDIECLELLQGTAIIIYTFNIKSRALCTTSNIILSTEAVRLKNVSVSTKNIQLWRSRRCVMLVLSRRKPSSNLTSSVLQQRTMMTSIVALTHYTSWLTDGRTKKSCGLRNPLVSWLHMYTASLYCIPLGPPYFNSSPRRTQKKHSD